MKLQRFFISISAILFLIANSAYTQEIKADLSVNIFAEFAEELDLERSDSSFNGSLRRASFDRKAIEAENRNREKALQKSIQDLADLLNVEEAEISVKKVEETVFNDSSLDGYEGETALMVLTPGYIVELAHEEETYRYHTDKKGNVYLNPDQLETIEAENRNREKAVHKSVQNLAALLNAEESEITVKNVEETVFNDSSLDGYAGYPALMVLTSGYIIELAHEGEVYRYHANKKGDVHLNPGRLKKLAREKIAEHEDNIERIYELVAAREEAKANAHSVHEVYKEFYEQLPEDHPFKKVILPDLPKRSIEGALEQSQEAIDILELAISELDWETIEEQVEVEFIVEVSWTKAILGIEGRRWNEIAEWTEDRMAEIEEYLENYELIEKANEKIAEHERNIEEIYRKKSLAKEAKKEHHVVHETYQELYDKLPADHPFEWVTSYPDTPLIGLPPGPVLILSRFPSKVFTLLEEEIDLLNEAIENLDWETIEEHLELDIPEVKRVLEELERSLHMYNSKIDEIKVEIELIEKYLVELPSDPYCQETLIVSGNRDEIREFAEKLGATIETEHNIIDWVVMKIDSSMDIEEVKEKLERNGFKVEYNYYVSIPDLPEPGEREEIKEDPDDAIKEFEGVLSVVELSNIMQGETHALHDEDGEIVAYIADQGGVIPDDAVGFEVKVSGKSEKTINGEGIIINSIEFFEIICAKEREDNSVILQNKKEESEVDDVSSQKSDEDASLRGSDERESTSKEDSIEKHASRNKDMLELHNSKREVLKEKQALGNDLRFAPDRPEILKEEGNTFLNRN